MWHGCRPHTVSEGMATGTSDTGTLLPELFAGHGPAQLAGLHAINMFLVRCAFDLLRSRRFHAVVERRVQLRLANITVPNFVAPLQLGSLDLGNTLPLVKSAHALPSPSKVLMPRLVMHIVYQGTCKLTVKTSINMKESAAAIAMEKTAEDLDRTLEGGSGFAGESSGAAGDATAQLDVSAEGEISQSALEAELQRSGAGGAVEDVAEGDAGMPGAMTQEVQGKTGKAKRSGSLAMLGYRSIKNMMQGGELHPLVGREYRIPFELMYNLNTIFTPMIRSGWNTFFRSKQVAVAECSYQTTEHAINEVVKVFCTLGLPCKTHRIQLQIAQYMCAYNCWYNGLRALSVMAQQLAGLPCMV